MRHFTFNTFTSHTTPHKQLEHYAMHLHQDTVSLINYIQYFAPNYKILNYSPGQSATYYSTEKLIEDGYILPARVLSTEDYYNQNFADENGNPNGESTLIIFPNKLELHEGLLNRFPEYDKSRLGVLLYYGNQEDIGLRDETINDMTYYFLSEDILQLDYIEPQYIWHHNSQDLSLFDIRLNTSAENTQFYGDDFRISSALNYFLPYAPSRLQRFEPAHIIVSMAMPENEPNQSTSKVRTDPNNYLICRFAAAGTYYHNTNMNTWTYSEKATDLYGESVVVTFTPCQLRYHTTDSCSWPAWSYSQFYDAYRYRNNNYDFAIQTSAGAVWTSQILSHKLIYSNQIDANTCYYDTFMCDDSSKITLANVDSHHIPRYTINIEKANTWDLDCVETVLW